MSDHVSSPRRRVVTTALATAITLLISLFAVYPSTASPGAAERSADPAAATGSIQPKLLHQFDESGGEPQGFWIKFADTADTSPAAEIDGWADRGDYVYDKLRATAEAAQAATVRQLEAAGVEYTTYWITNAIWVESGTLGLAQSLAAQTGVDRVLATVKYDQPEPVKEELTGAKLGPNAENDVEWGVANIKAEQVWDQYGVRGDGIVIANIDTGVQWDHPALVNSYRGNNGDGTITNDYNWFDVTGTSANPGDNNGHGTHTMGTMVGDDGAANRIGVAPGVTWIAASGCATCFDTDLIASAQWMLAPTRTDGTGADPAKRPNIVNNSWGSNAPSNDPFMEDILQSWADAGIFGVWSNGNNGPSCNTSGSPGSRTLNYSVGAYDEANTIADFSSRGSGQDGEIKPNISAPGALVRSSIPGGQYAILSGTSMAAPHAAGAVALLWSADPSLVGDIATTRQLLDDTAVDTADDQCGGTADDNNVYGEGRLDALALVNATDQSNLGTITGTVTDDEGRGVPGATIRLVAGSTIRSTRTTATGSYSVKVPAGDYNATVTAFGYEPGTASVAVTGGDTTALDIELVALPGYAVSGRVVDEVTGAGIPEATVTLAGSVFVAVADNHGNYTIPNVPGPRRYLVSVNAGICGDRVITRSLQVSDADVSMAPVVMPRRAIDGDTADGFGGVQVGRPYGYTCITEPSDWIPGDTPVDLVPDPDDPTPPTGDPAQVAELKLPFAFRFQGYPITKVEVKSQGGNTGTTFCVDERRWQKFRAGDNCPELPRLDVADLLTPREGSQVLTTTAGTAPNRTFTIEWRNFGIILQPHSVRMDVALTLHEDGDLVLAAHNIDPTSLVERSGGSAVFYGNGGSGGDPTNMSCCTTEYLNNYNSAINGWFWRSDATQMRIDLPDAGQVTGVVTDETSGKPIPRAWVDIVDSHGRLQWRYRTDPAGRYRAEIFTGETYQVSGIKPHGYDTRSATASARITKAHQTATADLTLAAAAPSVRLSAADASGDSARLSLRNSGTEPYRWRAALRTSQPGAPSPGTLTRWMTPGFKKYPLAIEEAGDSWWVALSGISGGQELREYTREGDATGRTISLVDIIAQVGAPTTLIPYDLAYIDETEELCFIGSNAIVAGPQFNDIICVKSATAKVSRVIATDIPAGDLARGLAYDEDEDSFLVQHEPWLPNQGNNRLGTNISILDGWKSNRPGTSLNTCRLYGVDGIGMAYQPGSDTLWKVVRGSGLVGPVPAAAPDVVQIDPTTCRELSASAIVDAPPSVMYDPRATDIREDGTLLMADTLSLHLQEVATGDTLVSSLPGVSLSQTSGVQGRGKSTSITVDFDEDAIQDDVTGLDLVLLGNSGSRGPISIPLLPAGTVDKVASTTRTTAKYTKRTHKARGKAVIRAADGFPATGKVRFLLKRGTRKVGTATTVVKNGTATVVFKKVHKAGRYQLIATYLGSAAVKNSSRKVAFRVR